ncbi:Phospholipase A(1) [Bertholletia excelsa]
MLSASHTSLFRPAFICKPRHLPNGVVLPTPTHNFHLHLRRKHPPKPTPLFGLPVAATSVVTPDPDPTYQIDQSTWQQLLGSNNWQGLLDPLDLNLRRLILRCGDLCQATYDSFNNDQNSPFCGCCRYGKTSFFDKAMIPNASHYQVAFYIYATAQVGVHEAFLLHSMSRESWDRESNWIGYVAVTTDDASRALGRREIYIVWRGTTRDYEWVDVLEAKLDSAKPLLQPQNLNKDDDDKQDDEKNVKVMEGWLTIYTSSDPKSPFTKLSAKEQVQRKIRELMNKYKDEKLSIVITGHSLGASLSVLSAFDLAENGISDVPIAAIIFGCPQVGNRAFNERLKEFTNVKILHIKNCIDMIPLYPGPLLGYVNSGIELEIDTRKSPSLTNSTNPSDWHNLQAMLHVVAGWNGAKGAFEMRVKRSLALVNKSCEFLKDECLVPGSWWVEKNRGMVLNKNGEWVMAPPLDEDRPVPEF